MIGGALDLEASSTERPEPDEVVGVGGAELADPITTERRLERAVARQEEVGDGSVRAIRLAFDLEGPAGAGTRSQDDQRRVAVAARREQDSTRHLLRQRGHEL